MRECYRTVNRYLTCKRTTDLHPVYKDVQYLSRQRKLYNLETHIAKYVLVILCMSVEVVGLAYVAILIGVLRIQPNEMLLTEMVKYQKEYPNCNFDYRLWKVLLTPQLIWFQNIAFFIIMLWFVLISILIRYLAARYLNHPFYKTLQIYSLDICTVLCSRFLFKQIHTHIPHLCFPSSLHNKLVSPVKR